MSDPIIPTTYAQWRECIEVRCKIPLTSEFVKGRLTELQDGDDPRTRVFEERYGSEHLRQTIAWFSRAAGE